MTTNQKERILKHMEDFGSITPVEAMRDYGIMRLASRISDLKREGYIITSETVIGRNRYGEKTHYSRYYLEGNHGKEEGRLSGIHNDRL